MKIGKIRKKYFQQYYCNDFINNFYALASKSQVCKRSANISSKCIIVQIDLTHVVYNVSNTIENSKMVTNGDNKENIGKCPHKSEDKVRCRSAASLLALKNGSLRKSHFIF